MRKDTTRKERNEILSMLFRSVSIGRLESGFMGGVKD